MTTGHSDLDSPAALARRLPKAPAAALRILAEHAVVAYPFAGIPAATWKALRTMGLAAGTAGERTWCITERGREVCGYLPD